MEQDQPRAGQTDRVNPVSESRRTAAARQAETPIQADPGIAAGSRDTVEMVLWAGRTHWRHYVGRIILWILGNLLASVLVGWLTSRVDWLTSGGAVWIVLGVVFVSGGLVLGRVALRVMGTYFRLTTQRLFIERGILSRTIDQLELTRIDDVRVYQTLLDRMFDIGSITLLTTDVTDRVVTIDGVRDPGRVSEAVRQQMRALRGKSLFVETLQ